MEPDGVVWNRMGQVVARSGRMELMLGEAGWSGIG